MAVYFFVHCRRFSFIIILIFVLCTHFIRLLYGIKTGEDAQVSGAVFNSAVFVS